MKFAQARIVTQDVPALVRFYRELTGMTPVGDDRYTELHGPQLSLAISSQRTIDLHSAGAATSQSNRSMILDFEVADVDQEYERVRSFVANSSLSRRRNLGAIARCCSAIPTAI